MAFAESISGPQETREHVSGYLDPGEAQASIYTLIGHYLPGFKVGGPLRSIENLVDALGQEFKFKIITSDRDFGSKLPYAGVIKDRWIKVGDAEVMYVLAGWRGLPKTISLLLSVDQDSVLYLNDFFSRRFSILPMFLFWLSLIRPKSVVLAPRGEFSPGALSIKRTRKTLYIKIARILNLYRNVIWHASSALEAEHIISVLSGSQKIRIAEVIPKKHEQRSDEDRTLIAVAEDISQRSELNDNTKRRHRPGQLHIVFVSRISRKKNLIGALRILEGVSGEIEFNVYGPAEDLQYWEECRRVIANLPPRVKVNYKGEIAHENIGQVFAYSDLFLFPTLGENYGHVIFEALSAGCPVLISDQTPWHDLEENNAGWTIPVVETERFRAILQQCVDADQEWHNTLSSSARSFAIKHISSSAIIDANRRLFRIATSGSFPPELDSLDRL